MSEEKKIVGALPIGAVINSGSNSYRVDSVLGQGGFGITYLVTRLSDGRHFAMKEYFRKELCLREATCQISYFPTNKDTIEAGIDDFITEARRLSSQNVSHPNIVTVHEVFRTNSTAYYIMEYIQGDDLLHFIRGQKNKPLTPEQAKSVMRPLLQAMALLHEKRITHLDIKPENIILTYLDSGAVRPVIIDFGLAKHYDKKGKATSTLTAAGCTDGFAPPEQYQGLTTFTPQADVYALAATMLYLITAKWPPKSSEISPKKILSLLDDDVPETLQSALIKALKRDKQERTQSVELLAADLDIDISEADGDDAHETTLIGGKKRKSYDQKTKKIDVKKPAKPREPQPAKPIDLKRYILPAAIAAGVVCAGIIGVFAVKSCNSTVGQQPDEQSFIIDENGDTIWTDNPEKEVSEEVDSVIVSTPTGEETPAVNGQKQEETRPDKSTADESKPEKPSAADNKPVQPQEESLDAQFARARTYKDYEALANKGYAKAYSKLATMSMSRDDSDAANRWVRKAKASGVGVGEARAVANQLKTLGYYDNGENGGYPFDN